MTSVAVNDINNRPAILIQSVLHRVNTRRTKYRMKWACVLPLLLIFCTHNIMCALSRTHPHGHEETLYRTGLDHVGAVMKDNSGMSRDASSSIKRSSSRRILEDQHSEKHDDSLVAEDYVKSDYGISDPPPSSGWPARKPVQYRIFNHPPAPTPHP